MSIAEKITTIANNVPLVFEAGKKAEHDSFWDVYMPTTRRDWRRAFANIGWTDTTFKPTSTKIIANMGASMFQNSGIVQGLSLIEEIDLTSMTDSVTNFANSCMATYFPKIKMPPGADLTQVFNYCVHLQTIEKMVVSENNKYSYTFNNCTALKNITIEGVIGNNISFANSPLNYESLMSIKAALAQVTTPKTLTLKASSFELLTQTDKDQIEAKGWTIVS